MARGLNLMCSAKTFSQLTQVMCMLCLCAGCPAVVANLWDVTDRDIDRFCEALLSRWLGPKGQAPVRPQGAGTRLSAALSGSRQACKLPHLIGAAPVCYGIPTELTWKMTT